MQKKKRPKRPRTTRKIADRAAEKTQSEVRKLVAEEPGGSSVRPIVLESAAQVEVAAKSFRCPLCEGELALLSHDAIDASGQRLRVARMQCRLCRAPWDRYYRLGAILN